MAVSLETIVRFCDFSVNKESVIDFPGACNGLQFENSGTVHRLGAAVDVSIETIQLAVKHEIDGLIVHHGMLWGPQMPIVESRFRKYRLLLEHDIAVYSCHLPLDRHPVLGNNASIANLLGKSVQSWDFPHEGTPIAAVINWNQPKGVLEAKLRALFPNMISLSFGPDPIDQVVISSGGSGDHVDTLKRKGYHTLIAGEGRQYHYNIAHEQGLNVYFCGHYATEVFGVQNLAEKVSREFSLPQQFLPSACPL